MLPGNHKVVFQLTNVTGGGLSKIFDVLLIMVLIFEPWLFSKHYITMTAYFYYTYQHLLNLVLLIYKPHRNIYITGSECIRDFISTIIL